MGIHYTFRCSEDNKSDELIIKALSSEHINKSKFIKDCILYYINTSNFQQNQESETFVIMQEQLNEIYNIITSNSSKQQAVDSLNNNFNDEFSLSIKKESKEDFLTDKQDTTDAIDTENTTDTTDIKLKDDPNDKIIKSVSACMSKFIDI